jgi:hypothetical protein
MANEHTTWSKTLLDGFIGGMAKNPTDEWILQEVRELADRRISIDNIASLLREELGDASADRFLRVTNKEPAGSGRPEKKSGLLRRLFGW